MIEKKKYDILEKEVETIYSKKEEIELREKWKKSLKEDYQITRKTPDSNIKKLIYSIAAILIISAGTFTVSFFLEKSLSETADKYVSEFEVISNPNYGQRGTEENKNNALLNTAYQNMISGKYEKAISNYLLADEQIGLGNYENFNLALSYLKTAQTEKSIIKLEQLTSKDSNYNEEANWLLSLGLLKAERNKEASNILSKIVTSKSYKYKQAEKILAKIN